jgi:hypothetical protein
MESYLPILQNLTQHKVQYVVIGTWALKALFPKTMQHYEIHDCDIVLLPTHKNIRKAIEVITQARWQASVWNVLISSEVEAHFLVGKFYVRAQNENLVLDMTYECALNWDILTKDIILYHHIPLASIENILILKRLKAQENDTLPALEEFVSNLSSV